MPGRFGCSATQYSRRASPGPHNLWYPASTEITVNEMGDTMPNVLVTGASCGLGLEFARQHADEGWEVIATCRDPDSATELRSLAVNVQIERADVSDFVSVDLAAKALAGPPVDILINNAGIGVPRQGAMDWTRRVFSRCSARTRSPRSRSARRFTITWRHPGRR